MLFRTPFVKKIHSIGVSLGIIALFSALGRASINTVWSVHLESVLGVDALVGVLNVVLLIIGLLFSLVCGKLVAATSERKMWIASTLAMIIGYVGIAFFQSYLVVFLLAICSVIGKVLHVTTFSILVRASFKKKEIGEAMGLQYAMRNVGWLLGPLVAGALLAQYNAQTGFVFGGFAVLLSILFFRTTKTPKLAERYVSALDQLKSIKRLVTNRHLRRSYLLFGGIELLWDLVYVFVPLYLVTHNLPIEWLGWFLFACALPLVFLEYGVGKITRKIGLRTLISVGYGTIALLLIVASFVRDPVILLSSFVLAGIGAALVEGSRETYFFDLVSTKDAEVLYGPLRTSSYVFSIAANALGAALLVIWTYHGLFFVGGLLMLGLMLLARSIPERAIYKRKASA